MKKLLMIGLTLISVSSIAPAYTYSQNNTQCYGSDIYKNCYDYNNGNQYTINRYGDTTQTYGYNANTGSNWSQTSRNYGNTTYQNGYDSDGNSWNQTIRHNGRNTNYSGTDSDGNFFNKTCYKNYDGSQTCY